MDRSNTYQKEFSIENNRDVSVNGTDGLKALEVVLAAYISKNERDGSISQYRLTFTINIFSKESLDTVYKEHNYDCIN